MLESTLTTEDTETGLYGRRIGWMASKTLAASREEALNPQGLYWMLMIKILQQLMVI
jgi:hypothetical protein